MAHLSNEKRELIKTAVVDHLEAHTHEAQDAAPERHVLVGQLSFFCLTCGDLRTIDTIAAEATAAQEARDAHD